MKSYMPKGTQSGDYLSTEPGQDPESSDLTSGPAPAVSRHVLMWLVTLPSTQLVSSWALPGVKYLKRCPAGPPSTQHCCPAAATRSRHMGARV